MKVESLKCGYAFTRNPIIISDEWEVTEDSPLSGTFEIFIADKSIYRGTFYPPLRVNIAEIIDANIEYLPEPDAGNIEPVTCLGQEFYDKRKVTVVATYGDDERSFAFTAIPGGVPSLEYKSYVAAEKDPFSGRFCDTSGNFFLTTRNTGKYLVMKETELYPLYFILDNEGSTISFRTADGLYSYNLSDTSHGLYMLDIAALRWWLFDKMWVLSSVIDVFVDGSKACTIVVERTDPAPELYRLKFRNSLGVFEIVEMRGSLKVNVAEEESEDTGGSAYQTYDMVTDSFFAARQRQQLQKSISIESGFKRPDEIRLLLDMIQSEEVYLLDFTDDAIRVIPSADSLTYQGRQTVPEKFTINMKVTVSDAGTVRNDSETSPFIFSPQFTKEFN